MPIIKRHPVQVESLFSMDIEPFDGGWGYVIKSGNLVVGRTPEPITDEWDALFAGEEALFKLKSEAELLLGQPI